MNALDRGHIQSFTELSQVVQKYCTMESTWKAQKTQLEPAALKQYVAWTKWMHPSGASDHQSVCRKHKPFTGCRSILDELLDKPCLIYVTPSTDPTHSLRACSVLWQVAKSG